MRMLWDVYVGHLKTILIPPRWTRVRTPRFCYIYYFWMLEAREHVSDHWRQGKCQLWADGFMCRRPASNEGPRISGNAPTHCFVERPYCAAMTHPSKWDGSTRMVSHIRYWEAHGKSTDGWRMEVDIINVLKRAYDWWHTQYPIQEKRNVQKVINIHVKKMHKW